MTDSFYTTGGSLRSDAPSYVERAADRELLDGLLRGEFCYVLTSRQMGKSSLTVRTAIRLREAGVQVVVLDLTALGQNLTADQWYYGLLVTLGDRLHLEDELDTYWWDHEEIGPLQRFMRALREIVLPALGDGRLVVFVDELDTARSLPFSTDEFFAAIRRCYNARAEDPAYERLTFCLLGVATPGDLIRDTRLTPFNIGRRIDLADFTTEEARLLAAGLVVGEAGTPLRSDAEAKALLARVLYWTGGHPYLTQRLCRAVAADTGHSTLSIRNSPLTTRRLVDRHAEELFLSAQAREKDDNLLFVRERLLRSEGDGAAPDLAGLLELYGHVLGGGRLRPDDTNPLLDVLRLSGVVRLRESRAPVRAWRRARSGFEVRNRIYRQVFDRRWIAEHMPDAEVRRQMAAFRRGVVRTAAVASVLFACMAGLTLWALDSRRSAREATVVARRDRDAARSARQRERIHREGAQRAADRERRSAAEARRAQEEARNQARRAGEAAARERRQFRLAEERYRENRRILYLADMSAAALAWKEGQTGRHRELLERHGTRLRGEEDLRGFEWYYHRSQADRVAWSGDFAVLSPQARILMGFRTKNRLEGKLQAIRLDTGRVVYDGAFKLDAAGYGGLSPDERYLATVDRQRAAVIETATGRQVLSIDARGAPFMGANLDNRRIALLRSDGLGHVRALPSGRVISRYRAPVTAGSESRITFAPGGHRLVVASGSRLVLIDVSSGRTLLLHAPGDQTDFASPFEGSEYGGPEFLADGTRLVACYTSKELRNPEAPDEVRALLSLRVWDARDGQLIHSATVSRVPVASHDRRLLLTVSPHRKESPGDADAVLWNLRENPPARQLSFSLDESPSSRFSPRDRYLAVLDDSRFRVCDLESGREVKAVARSRPPQQSGGPAEGSPVPCEFGFSADEGRFFTMEATRFQLWDAKGNPLASADGDDPAFSPDGRNFALIDNSGDLKVHSAEGGRLLAAIENVQEFRFLPGSRRVLVRNEDGLSLWKLRSQEGGPPVHLGRFPRHTDLDYVQFSWDGQRMLTNTPFLFSEVARDDEPARLWKLDSRVDPQELTESSRDVLSVTFSPDSRLLAGAGDDGNVRVWNARTGQSLHVLDTGSNYAFTVAFSPDGRRLGCATYGGEALVWDRASGRRLFTLDHDGPVTSIAFSPDGRRIATASDDMSIRIWSSTGRLLRTLRGHTDKVNSVVFSPDGRRIASGGDDAAIRIWDWSASRGVKTLWGHRQEVRAVAYSPDGLLLASAERTGSCILWDALTGKEIRSLKGVVTSLFTLQFSPDGRRLATGAAGNSVKLWDVDSGREVLVLDGPQDVVTAVAFAPDGSMLAAASRDAVIRLWRAPGHSASIPFPRAAASAQILDASGAPVWGDRQP